MPKRENAYLARKKREDNKLWAQTRTTQKAKSMLAGLQHQEMSVREELSVDELLERTKLQGDMTTGSIEIQEKIEERNRRNALRPFAFLAVNESLVRPRIISDEETARETLAQTMLHDRTKAEMNETAAADHRMRAQLPTQKSIERAGDGALSAAGMFATPPQAKQRKPGKPWAPTTAWDSGSPAQHTSSPTTGFVNVQSPTQETEEAAKPTGGLLGWGTRFGF